MKYILLVTASLLTVSCGTSRRMQVLSGTNQNPAPPTNPFPPQEFDPPTIPKTTSVPAPEVPTFGEEDIPPGLSLQELALLNEAQDLLVEIQTYVSGGPTELLEQARADAWELAATLNSVGLSVPAEALAEQGNRVDVYRLYHPKGDHLLTTSAIEALSVIANLGFRYEGIGFQTYRRIIGLCNVPIYRCYRPGVMADKHSVSLNSTCRAGETQEGVLGLVCPTPTGSADRELASIEHPVGDHLATTNPTEFIALVMSTLWNFVGVLGYVP